MKIVVGKLRAPGWLIGYISAISLGVAVLSIFGLGNSYTQQLVFLTASGAVAAICMYLVVGLSGQFALITNALIGVGAYAAALSVIKFGMNYLVASLVAAAISGVLGLIIGGIALRIRGHYLALASVGFSIVVVQILTNWRSVTRGSSALTGIPKPSGVLGLEFTSRPALTLVTLAFLAVVALGALIVNTSKLGTAAKILREDEELAESVGINTYWLKVVIFSGSGAVLGLQGTIHAAYLGLLQPDMFSIFGTVNHLIMVIVGGFSVLGAALGAAVVTLLPEYLRFLSQGRELALGIVLLVVILGAPEGLVGLARGFLKLFRRPKAEAPQTGSLESHTE